MDCSEVPRSAFVTEILNPRSIVPLNRWRPRRASPSHPISELRSPFSGVKGHGSWVDPIHDRAGIVTMNHGRGGRRGRVFLPTAGTSNAQRSTSNIKSVDRKSAFALRKSNDPPSTHARLMGNRGAGHSFKGGSDDFSCKLLPATLRFIHTVEHGTGVEP